MRDLLPETVSVRDDLMNKITEVYRSYGYGRIETPCIEDIARLSSNEGGENEKLVYRILKRGLDSELDGPVITTSLVDLGLRFDLTVPLTRFYANNQAALPQPFRSLQIGSVWRAERPQKGRYRQFTQCDIDLIGEPTALAEAELIEATLAALSRLGLRDLTVRLSDRRLLTALAHEAGIPVERTGSLFITLDKLDKIGWDGIQTELLQREFDSTAVERCIQLVADLQEVATSSRWDTLRKLLPSLDQSIIEDLATTASCLDLLFMGEDVSWTFDPTLVRGMGYYTGQIFEVAHPASSSSIAGGGRYDKLIGKTLGRDVPACGFSLGFERIAELITTQPTTDKLAVLFDEDVDIADALVAARQLRAHGRVVSVVRRRGQFGKQLGRLETENYTSYVVCRKGGMEDERQLGVRPTQ
ncbi:MAG TPA: histidine--tRNA ligase [Pseudonocardiaceae bacterium]